MTLLLATLEQVKTEIKTATTSETEQQVILQMIAWASARIANKLAKKGTSAEPLVQTRPYPAQRSNTLILNGSLAELTGVTVGGGVTTLQPADYLLQPYAPPYTMLSLVGQQNLAGFEGSPLNATRVSGVWVWHTDYANAWQLQATVAAEASADQTTIEVASTVGLTAGLLLKVGSEYLRVVQVEEQTLTVLRGQQGTARALLPEGAAVYRWHPDDLIVRAVVRAAGLLHRRRGAFEQVTYDSVATTTFPTDLPAEVTNILAEIPFFHGWRTV